MLKKVRHLVFFIFSLFFLRNAFSQDEGIKLFEQNKPAEAIAFLEADIASGKSSPIEYNYLGLAYFQIGNYAKSVEAFKKGTAAPGTDKKMIYFNMGNSFFAMGNFQEALDSYAMASVADPSYAAPVLNKANTEIKTDKLTDAVADYKRYLLLMPDSPQRPQIEQIIAMIETELSSREERERLAAEEAARLKAEEDRIAREKAERDRLEFERRMEEERLAAEKRAQEEERRKKMLEDVANSLRDSKDTTNISADAEDTLEYDYDSDIE